MYKKRENKTFIVGKSFTKPSKTDQSFKKECDVNHIMSRFAKTGEITHLRRQQGVYADITNLKGLQESAEQLHTVREIFNELPSELREKLDNNPLNFIDYLQDPKNLEEATKYGFFEKPNTEIQQQKNDDQTTIKITDSQKPIEA